MQVRSRAKRAVLIAVVALVLLALAGLSILPPLITSPMIDLHVDFQRMYAADDFGLTAERVDLTTQDGLRLVAYEVRRPNPKAVIIFLSGIQNPSVTAFFGHARWLAGHGYASLLLEMRAHGESEGDLICLGYREHLDVRAAVDYLRASSAYDGVPIVVYGLSMGGATAINAAGQIPEIAGVISLSAFSSWPDVFADNMALQGAPAWLAAAEKPFVAAYTALRFGPTNAGITPARQIARLGDRPALLIHSRGDSQVPFASFERLVARAPGHVETWVVEGDRHLIIDIDDYEHPERAHDYAATILGFLERHWGGESRRRRPGRGAHRAGCRHRAYKGGPAGMSRRSPSDSV